MRRRIVRAAVAVSLLLGVSLAYAYSTGPPYARTGAPIVGTIPAEGLCISCHVGSAVNDPAGKLEILNLPAQYIPTETYHFRVRLSFAHDVADSVAPYRWGFELTPVQASNGRGVGTLIPSLPGQQVVTGSNPFGSRQYLEHTDQGVHDGEVGSVEWMCTWVAPPADSGPVTFFVAGNAANGDATPLGDHIFTTSATMLSGTQVAGVGPGPVRRYSLSLDPAYPNPFTRFTDFAFSVPRAGKIDLAVFDLQGRRIKSLRSGAHQGGLDGLTWWGDRDDGSQAAAGVYFARLRVEGERASVTQRVTLTR